MTYSRYLQINSVIKLNNNCKYKNWPSKLQSYHQVWLHIQSTCSKHEQYHKESWQRPLHRWNNMGLLRIWWTCCFNDSRNAWFQQRRTNGNAIWHELSLSKRLHSLTLSSEKRSMFHHSSPKRSLPIDTTSKSIGSHWCGKSPFNDDGHCCIFHHLSHHSQQSLLGRF